MFHTKVISLLMFEVLEKRFEKKDLFLQLSKYRTTIESFNDELLYGTQWYVVYILYP